MAKVLITILVVVFAPYAGAQTVEISPPELIRVPVPKLGSGRYWQQLVVVLGQDHTASDTVLSIGMPFGMTLADTDGDSLFADELRIVYVPVDDEVPGFFVSQNTVADLLVVGTQQAALRGGQIYLQFPVSVSAFPADTDVRYGPIIFADDREADLIDGPWVRLVTQEEFNTTDSMNLVALGTAFEAGEDTTTSALGTVYPDTEEILVRVLPDLVFDAGASTRSNLVSLGDEDDSNDVEYRFFLSASGTLNKIDESSVLEVLTSAGDPYVEREGVGRITNLLFRDVEPGLYYLYVTSSVTGEIPLARSRGLLVRHEPVFQGLGPGESITLDSGDLLGPNGAPIGRSIKDLEITYSLIDHDSEPFVHLFYSEDGELGATEIVGDAKGGLTLEGALPLIGVEGLIAKEGHFVWDILDPVTVSAGDYFIYAAATDLSATALMRSAGIVQVRHAPFLRMDALNDGSLSWPDTIITGGIRPQRFITFSWGRRGFDGDADIDDDALIDLYLSPVSATPFERGPNAARVSAGTGFTVPGGGDQVQAALITGDARLIAGNIPEDPDERVDNQYVWDLWALEASEFGVPKADSVYYAYGLISDAAENRCLAQMNGGQLNDMASQLVFVHPPSIRVLQPVAPIIVQPGQSGRVAWDDMDLDDDAKIRVLLCREDRGEISTYADVAAGLAYVVNSADGRAETGVDSLRDLSEDSARDHFEVAVDHLERAVAANTPLANGDYFIYLAIADTDDFGHALAVRAPGLVRVQGLGNEAEVETLFQLLPEVFSLGTGGQIQVFEIVVNTENRVDVVQLTLVVDSASFAVIDQDSLLEGIQPFVVGSGFQSAKLVTNQVEDDELGSLRLSMAYFEPRASGIPGLGPDRLLATFELESLDLEGAVSIDLEVETDRGQVSRIALDGQSVAELDAGPVSLGELVAGRAIIEGMVNLEGRQDMTAAMEFFLRRWGEHLEVVDEVFAEANDVDPIQDGVQVEINADGSFTLLEVPMGRWDLHARLAGYLEAWIPGLELFSAQVIENVQPASPGSGERPRVLGGDVVGYLETDGTSSQDNEVTLADWDFVAAFFGLDVEPGSESERADITGDGEIDIQDLSLVGANFHRRGPLPVYKSAEGQGVQSVQLLGPDKRPELGETVEFIVVGNGFTGIRAYELDLEFDQTQWQWVDAEVTADHPLMATKRRDENSLLVGATLIGRGSDLSMVGTLLNWRLRALRTGAAMPRILRSRVVDTAHRVHLAAIDYRADRGAMVFHLEQNYPNPFNPETVIDFTVPVGLRSVRLEVFDVLGRRVALLWDGEMAPGANRLYWRGLDQEGRPAASGVYIYRLESGEQELVKRMVLVR